MAMMAMHKIAVSQAIDTQSPDHTCISEILYLSLYLPGRMPTVDPPDHTRNYLQVLAYYSMHPFQLFHQVFAHRVRRTFLKHIHIIYNTFRRPYLTVP